MIIDIVCTFSATTIQAETKSVSLVLTFPATQLPSNICEEVKDCLGISESGDETLLLNQQGDWVAGGGGSQTLNEVLVEGNETDGEDIFVSDGDAIYFDNGSRVRKGLTDAGNGGAKGVALVCSLDYELKWEAGRLYTMQQDGFTIREVSHNFTATPTVNDDITKGFVIGSRWILDNGDVYVCSDETASAAVWVIVANADWNASSGSQQILNKPTIPSISGLVPYTGATQNVDLGTYNIIADQVQLNVTPNGTLAVGMTEWNDTVGVSQTLLKGGSVTLKNGVDLVARVVNKVSPNTTLTKAAYQVVKISGAQGQRLAVDLAQANNDNNSADTLGIVTETIAANQEGFIMTVGQLEGINTTGSLQGETWADGDVLYLSPTVAGRMTNVKPTGATGHIVILGYVEYAHANNGKIYVKIMNGWELDELHNVYINTGTLANNDALIYESSTQLWKNKTIATALGFTPENVANKSDSFTASSSTTYASTKALVDGLASLTANNISVIAKVSNLTMTGVTTERCLMVIPLEVGNDNWDYVITNWCRISTGSGTTYLRVGTVASPIDGDVGANAIANQTLVATYNHGNNNRTPFKRTLNVFGGAGGGIIRANASVSIINDETSANSFTNTLLNMTVQRYVYLSYNLTNPAFTYSVYSAFATKLKMN
jgi:nitrogen fixation protein